MRDQEVDCQAMLSAYVAEMSEAEVREDWNPIAIRIHKGNDENTSLVNFRIPIVHRIRMPIVVCGDRACRRCRNGKSTWDFSWFAPRWAEKYVKWARKDAWRPQGPKGKGYGPGNGQVVHDGGEIDSGHPEEEVRCILHMATAWSWNAAEAVGAGMATHRRSRLRWEVETYLMELQESKGDERLPTILNAVALQASWQENYRELKEKAISTWRGYILAHSNTVEYTQGPYRLQLNSETNKDEQSDHVLVHNGSVTKQGMITTWVVGGIADMPTEEVRKMARQAKMRLDEADAPNPVGECLLLDRTCLHYKRG